MSNPAPLKIKLTENQAKIVEAAISSYKDNGFAKAGEISLTNHNLTIEPFDFASLLDHMKESFENQLELRRIRSLALKQISERKLLLKKDSSRRHYESMEMLMRGSRFGVAL